MQARYPDEEHQLAALVQRQSGVVTRAQLLAAGHDDDDVRRLRRRRHLVRLHRGVYLTHTGAPDWLARAWAAVLFHCPAALCHRSALMPGGDLVHVAIAHPRSAGPLPGVRLHRVRGLDDRVLWNASPPRLRVEEAALDVAAEATDPASALAILADLCTQRRTTPTRLLEALDRRSRLRHRAWLRSALADLASGARSVLERDYLGKVERAHGLPAGARQVRETTPDGVVYRDVAYHEHALLVELDGRLGHTLSGDRGADLDRDLAAAAEGRLTLRLGWRQVHGDPCGTARRVARVLRSRGWLGAPRRCGPSCTL